MDYESAVSLYLLALQPVQCVSKFPAIFPVKIWFQQFDVLVLALQWGPVETFESTNH